MKRDCLEQYHDKCTQDYSTHVLFSSRKNRLRQRR
jgi:hypothetical protein